MVAKRLAIQIQYGFLTSRFVDVGASVVVSLGFVVLVVINLVVVNDVVIVVKAFVFNKKSLKRLLFTAFNSVLALLILLRLPLLFVGIISRLTTLFSIDETLLIVQKAGLVTLTTVITSVTSVVTSVNASLTVVTAVVTSINEITSQCRQLVVNEALLQSSLQF